MGFLSDVIGNIGTFLGINPSTQKKKKDEQPRPTVSIQRNPSSPFGLSAPQYNNNPTIQAPRPLVPNPADKPDENPLTQIGGVTMHTPTAPIDSAAVHAARDEILKGGSGAPFRPEVIAAARRPDAPVSRPIPVMKNLNDFTGSANNAGARALIGGAAGLFNLLKNGFDTAKAGEDTDNFLNTIGLGNTDKTRTGLASGVDFNSRPGKGGQVVGGIEGGINPVTPIVEGTEGIGTTLASALAQKHLLDAGVDPNIIQEASDHYTNRFGVNSQQSAGQNALAIGGQGANLALGLAGADSLIPKGNPFKRPAVEPIVVGKPRDPSGAVQPTETPPTPPKEAVTSTNRPIEAAPVDPNAPVPKLGTITRQAIIDGSIKTPEGISKTIADTTTAAHAEAEAAGETLPNIIAKGQAIWEKSKAAGHDLTTEEVLKADRTFTPEQQQVYKNYAQEIGTLRDRSGLSVDGGQQGAWYAPRQALVDDGGELKSAEFNPQMVNEIARDKAGGLAASELDTSHVPFEHALQRYANAPDASTQTLVQAVETSPKTGEASGLVVPDDAKARLQESFASITDKRDQALKLDHEGNAEQANALKQEVQKDIDKAFNQFADDIPGSGKTRREAINTVKAMRGTYMQTTMQTLSLSNVVNRAADQGTRAAYIAEQPLTRGLEKVFSPIMKSKGMPNVEAPVLNTTKEARVAAKQVAKGTLGREVASGFRANMASAGAGRNIIAKGIAKLDALPRALSTAATQFGDLSTQNVQKALQLGASRPEAAGLKTVEDYRKYFGDYVNTNKFKEDLDSVTSMNNPRIGLAGSKHDNMDSGGKISGGISKYLDNGIKNAAAKIGIKNNRLVNEVNDYVKGNITGYAGVGTRVAGTVGNAALGGIPRVVKALKIAKNGDPTAVAHATQYAAQSVADAIAAYGTGAAALLIANKSGGAIGFTGPRAKEGSSESSYNKSHNIPANQWYVNLPNGQRVYFDPARPLGAPGVAADVAGSISSGRPSGETALSVGGQIYNQTGGSSLPNTIVNATTAADPASGSQNYAWQKTQEVLAPSTGILNNFANWQDPTKRAPTNFVDDIKSNLPGLRSQTPAAKDSMGQPISNSKQISGGSSLFSVAENPNKPAPSKANPVDSELTRLEGRGHSAMPTNSNTNADNPANKKFANLLLKNKLYTDADDETKANMLKDVLTGKTAKNISDKIPEKDQQALLEGKLVGDKQKAWLDDNDNAAKYYTAQYDNAQARGTLTHDDEDLQVKSGLKYKAIAAQVDKEVGADARIKQLYQDVSSTEFKAMLDPESEDYDPDTAAELQAYDKARTAAGVSGKDTNSSKLKYIPKKEGSGKGGRRGYGPNSGQFNGGNFTFANIPSSLIGNSTKNASYADAAPLFKPIADLQAPPTVVIPKGRTISVKPGYQL